MYFSGIGVPVIELIVTPNKYLRLRGDVLLVDFVWHLVNLGTKGMYPVRYSLRYVWTNPDYDNDTVRAHFVWLHDGLNEHASLNTVLSKVNRYWMSCAYPEQAFNTKLWTSEHLVQVVLSPLIAEFFQLLFQRQLADHEW